MCDFISIKKLYDALNTVDIEEFDEVYFGIRDGKYMFYQEDIAQLCSIITCNFPYIEPHQERKIVKMTFITIDRYHLQPALKELIKGLKNIFEKSLTDLNGETKNFSYEEIVEEYVSMFVNSYDKPDIIVFGELINRENCQNFKLKIIKILEMSMEYAEDNYLIKGKILLDIIK
jgi:hypothetical protein